MDFLNYSDDFTKCYFDEETWAKLQRHRTAAKTLRVYERRAWLKLFREAESLLDTDPRAEKTHDLALRWCELWEISTFGDSKIQEAQVRAWKDRSNWPAEAQEMIAQLNLEKIAPFMAAAIAHHRVRELARKRNRGHIDPIMSFFGRREHLSEEVVEHTLRPWVEVLKEAQDLLDHEPSTMRVQALVRRWNKLWQSIPRYEFRLKTVLRDALTDPQKWPPSLRPEIEGFDLPRITEFMKQVIAANMKQRYRDSTQTGAPSDAWINLWRRLCRNVGLA